MNKEGRSFDLPEIRIYVIDISGVRILELEFYLKTISKPNIDLLHSLPLYHKFPLQFGEVDKFRQRERNKRVSNR